MSDYNKIEQMEKDKVDLDLQLEDEEIKCFKEGS